MTDEIEQEFLRRTWIYDTTYKKVRYTYPVAGTLGEKLLKLEAERELEAALFAITEYVKKYKAYLLTSQNVSVRLRAEEIIREYDE